MDEFLKPNALYNNVLNKYLKHGRLIVACDFDRTLFDSKQKGESYEMVRQLVRNLYAIDCYIIIWTGNENLDFVRAFLEENNVPFHSINEDAPFTDAEYNSRKICADVFIDDRAGLIEVYSTLNRFLEDVNNSQ